MKTLIVTTPIRPSPTDFPPLGSLSLVDYLRRHGVADIEFYNIDANRPEYEAVLAHIRKVKPGVLGISAVVSTAYAYTKRLSQDVKAALPETLIVVGGNLAASAEMLLRMTGTDLCVLGEGERVFLNVVRRAAETRDPTNYADIPGLMLLDGDGNMVNTGYETPLPKEEIYRIDWDDLAASSDIGFFIYDPFQPDGAATWLTKDPRLREPDRQGKTVIQFPSAKGCVARCTFCHRWDKGIRYIPVDVLMRRIEELIEKYNVGILVMADENFGTDRRWLSEFCAKIKFYDLLWRVAGMRVNCITPDQIAMMKDAGCISIIYGMETGSEKMLQIMEKKVKLQDNYNAMEWTVGAGLYTVVQLVLGMPGESPETVAETIAFCKVAMTLDGMQNPNDVSINYAQALPGTPLYEFGRHKGLIGETLEEEEKYLLRISDRDAHDEVNTLNFTDYPTLECQTWRPRITVEVNYQYVTRYGLDHYRRVLLKDANFFKVARKDSGYFANPKRLVDRSITTDTVHDLKEAYLVDEGGKPPSLWSLLKKGNFGLALICNPVVAYRLRRFLVIMILIKHVRSDGFGYAYGLLAEYLWFKLREFRARNVFPHDYKSLRKIVIGDLGELDRNSPQMMPLRRGR